MTEPMWPAKPKIFALWPFKEKLAVVSLGGWDREDNLEKNLDNMVCALRAKNRVT